MTIILCASNSSIAIEHKHKVCMYSVDPSFTHEQRYVVMQNTAQMFAFVRLNFFVVSRWGARGPKKCCILASV